MIMVFFKCAKYAKCDDNDQTGPSGACKISTEEHKNTFYVNRY